MRLMLVATSILICGLSAAGPIRPLPLSRGELGAINCSIGYSTILQFESRPLSVVIGDQDGFKVEYTGNSVTIKPLISGARTNLFVFTEYDQFGFTLSTVSSGKADYMLKVRRDSGGITQGNLSGPVYSKMETTNLHQVESCGGLTLSMKSISVATDSSWTLVSFDVRAAGGTESETIQLGTSEMSVTNAKKTLPLRQITLKPQEIHFGGPSAKGSILFKAPLTPKLHLTLSTPFLRTRGCSPLKVELKMPNQKNRGRNERKDSKILSGGNLSIHQSKASKMETNPLHRSGNPRPDGQRPSTHPNTISGAE